jgi:hypothetical protein
MAGMEFQKSLRPCFLAGLGLVAVVGQAMAHPPARLSAQSEAGMVEEVHVFRKRMVEAAASRNTASLRNAYAERFVHTDPTGKREGREARIAALLAGTPAIETAPVRDLTVHIHAGGWVAIAVGTSPLALPPDGKPHAVHWTTTYARNGEAWQIVASHATRGDEWKN